MGSKEDAFAALCLAMRKTLLATLATSVMFISCMAQEDVNFIVPERAATKGATFIMRHSKEALKKLHVLSSYRVHHEVASLRQNVAEY